MHFCLIGQENGGDCYKEKSKLLLQYGASLDFKEGLSENFGLLKEAWGESELLNYESHEYVGHLLKVSRKIRDGDIESFSFFPIDFDLEETTDTSRVLIREKIAFEVLTEEKRREVVFGIEASREGIKNRF